MIVYLQLLNHTMEDLKCQRASAFYSSSVTVNAFQTFHVHTYARFITGADFTNSAIVVTDSGEMRVDST